MKKPLDKSSRLAQWLFSKCLRASGEGRQPSYGNYEENGGMDTALPEEVADKMKTLLADYNAKEEKTFEAIFWTSM